MNASKEREQVSLDVAIGLLHARCEDGFWWVHTFRQRQPPASRGVVLLGMDLERDHVIEAMRCSPWIDVTGPMAQALGHGLVIEDEDGQLFICTHELP